MASLSEQVREIVNRSSASRYAVARKIGVSEALLSRFLSGERGVSLATLDKLADVFGIVAIEGTLQTLPRPTKRGRKPKEVVMTTAVSKKRVGKEYWAQVAFSQAKINHDANFSSRRGIYEIVETPTKSGSVLCIYNNNPYTDLKDGQSPKRDLETSRLREFLKQQGIKELAYETYPPRESEESGYTFAMILDATEEDEAPIVREYERILCETYA